MFQRTASDKRVREYLRVAHPARDDDEREPRRPRGEGSEGPSLRRRDTGSRGARAKPFGIPSGPRKRKGEVPRGAPPPPGRPCSQRQVAASVDMVARAWGTRDAPTLPAGGRSPPSKRPPRSPCRPRGPVPGHTQPRRGNTWPTRRVPGCSRRRVPYSRGGGEYPGV